MQQLGAYRCCLWPLRAAPTHHASLKKINCQHITDYFNINVPNVFTPNNDGKNDLFKISLPGRMYECATLSIFNKWGQIQYFNDDSNLDWDGTNNSGVSAPVGTYFYTISIKHETSNGAFQLFR